jgi:pyruvate,water dikinase
MFLVQARPVTAVTAGSAVAWTSTNMSENFPKPLTPFAWSVVDEFYTRYMQNLTRLLGIRDPELHRRRSPINRLTGAQGGRVYYNIKSWYELLQTYVPCFGGVFRRYLDHYIGQSVPIALDREESDATALRFATGARSRISFWSRLVFHLSRGRHYLNRFERMFLDYRTALRQPPYHTLDPAALIEKLDALFEDFVARHWYHQCVADFSVLLFPGILDALVDRWIPNRRDDPGRISSRLLQRISVPSTDSAVIIQRLSRAVGECETLQGLLERRRYAALEEALPPSPKKLFTEFMERFGSRCYHECMIVSPTFEERTDLFWELVEKYQRLDRSRHAEARDKVSDTEAEDERARILQTVPVGKRQLVRLALGRAQRAIALREQGRMVQSLLFGEVRRLALALGEKLVELGHVRAADDVFFLGLSEVRDLCYGKFLLPETAPRLVAMRREALERCDRFEPPECFVLPEGVYFDHHARTSTVQDERTLRGVSASAGRACGTAKVILDPVVDKQLEPGDILVARSTDPGWTPLFMIAGGLVLERGGILSHGAIVAREFGIPAVVGVEGATKRIREGDAVSVDGDRGEVTTLDDGVPIRTEDRHARCGEDRKSA